MNIMNIEINGKEHRFKYAILIGGNKILLSNRALNMNIVLDLNKLVDIQKYIENRELN